MSTYPPESHSAELDPDCCKFGVLENGPTKKINKKIQALQDPCKSPKCAEIVL